MATKIRLQRHGRKKKAFFHIVVTDERAPRDGRYIEKLGTYNPGTNPATIEMNLESAVKWLRTGAQPTDTARAILSYKGALYRKHLQIGVDKGAITQETADAKFAEWVAEKENKINSKRERLATEKTEKRDSSFKAEMAKREAIAAKVLAKNSELTAEVEAATAAAKAAADVTTEAAEEVATETAIEETPVVADVVVETAAVEEIVEPAAEVVAEPATEDVVETPAAEVAVETPAEEVAETPSEESSEETV